MEEETVFIQSTSVLTYLLILYSVRKNKDIDTILNRAHSFVNDLASKCLQY